MTCSDRSGKRQKHACGTLTATHPPLSQNGHHVAWSESAAQLSNRLSFRMATFAIVPLFAEHGELRASKDFIRAEVDSLRSTTEATLTREQASVEP
jgi:hypothetical protein